MIKRFSYQSGGRALENSERLHARLSTLRFLGRALAKPLDLTGVVRTLHAELGRVLDVTICFFGLYDAAAQNVQVVWQVHDGQELPGGHFPLGSGPTSQAIRHCQPQLIRRWSTDGPRVQVQYATSRSGLPESSIVVPVIFDGAVIGVLSLQSYEPEAYDQEDVAFVQACADLAAVALAGQRPSSSDLELVIASLTDALLVLDEQARLVRLNPAARKLLCVDSSVIVGQPVDQPQDDHWPLGTRRITDQLRPVVEQLKHGAAPATAFQLSLDGAVDKTLSCTASVLMKDGAPAGGVLVLREA